MDELQRLCDRAGNLLDEGEDAYYIADDFDIARRDRAKLVSLRSGIDELRLELKKKGELPSERESAIKALLTRLGHRLELISEFLHSQADMEREKRRRELKQIYDLYSAPLGLLADEVWRSPAFPIKGWDNPNSSIRIFKRSIKEKIDRISRELASIYESEGQAAPAMVAKYLEALSLDALSDFKRRAAAAALPNIGLKPTPICIFNDITTPERLDFVSFDLEISGSLGLDSGDAPPEIIEFGAVKVENGVITDRYSRLCNPGRKITPQVVKLTGITDKQLAGAPSVADALEEFLRFSDGKLLIGHGIKTSDLVYLRRAAENSGRSLKLDCFDTFSYAERVAKQLGFTKLNLDGLADSLGIVRSTAHRALADAECTVEVYLKLRELTKPSEPTLENK